MAMRLTDSIAAISTRKVRVRIRTHGAREGRAAGATAVTCGETR